MDDPDLQGDEQILIRTQSVHVKSISFEAILTNKRIILVDRLKNILPPKEIPLATIQSLEAGENAIRDLVITLGVITKSGGARQMVLTFSREGGGNRVKERDEWIRQIRSHLNPSFEQVIRKVIPGMESQMAGQDAAAYQPSRSPVPVPRPAEYFPPVKKVMEKPPESWQASVSAPVPVPAPETILGTYCTRCGTKVPEGSDFCTKCGTRIIRPGETPQVPVSVPGSPKPVSVAPQERPIDHEVRSIEPLIAKSPVTLPDNTTPAAPPLPEVSPPDSAASLSTKPVVEKRPAAATAVPAGSPPAKKRFMPKLFSPRDLPPTPLIPSSMPTAVPPPPKKPSSRKKILLVAGIIVIILIAVAAAVVVLPKMGLPGNAIHGSTVSATATPAPVPAATTKPAVSSNTTIVIATPTPISIPSTGVYVGINYIGGFTGSYSTGGVTTTVTPNSGSQMYQVANATGSVTAVFQKTDNTATHALTVGIYENGKQIAANNTSASYGKVTVTASV